MASRQTNPGIDAWLAVDNFAFDALLQNPDRRHDHPNLLTSGDARMVLDHQAAFSFVRDILPIPAPWTLDRQEFLADHVFYRQLESKLIDLTRFVAKLREVSNAILDQAFADVPQMRSLKE
jgi:hypothetical protein